MHYIADDSMGVPSRRSYGAVTVALVAMLAVAWFAGLDLRGLFFPDEGRYAEIPREMLVSGDWITPRLNGLKYFEKPPLQYWLTAASFAVFGEDEWTARLPAALLGFCAIAAVGFTARRLWHANAGTLAAVILGSSWAFYLSGQYLTLDMSLSAILAFALCAFLLAQSPQTTLPESRFWMLVSWAAAAFAVLCKGLVGVVLPALALGLYTAWTKDSRVWRRLYLLPGLGLFLAIALPWFVLMQREHPEFFHFFFVYEHLQRFAENGHSRNGAWWYYLPILVFGLMPWTPALLQRGISDRQPATQFRADRFCIAWAVSVIVFFSISKSKLPAYIIPAFPALAMVIACRHRYFSSQTFRWCALSLACIGALLIPLVSYLPYWRKFADIGPDAIAALPLLYGAVGILVFSGLAGMRLEGRARIGMLVCGSFAAWNMVFAFLHEVDEQFSSERLAEELTENIVPFHPELPFYSIGQFDHSLPFYLGRTVTLVDTRGELGPGIDAEPDKVIASSAAFNKLWTGLQQQAYAVMTPARFSELAQTGLPMSVVVQDRRLVIVSRFETKRDP